MSQVFLVGNRDNRQVRVSHAFEQHRRAGVEAVAKRRDRSLERIGKRRRSPCRSHELGEEIGVCLPWPFAGKHRL